MSQKHPGLYKRGVIWWFKYTLGGVKHRISTGLTNEDAAWIFTDKYRAMVELERKYGAMAWPVFKEEFFSLGVAALKAGTVVSKRHALSAFEQIINPKMLLELNPDNLQTVVDTWFHKGKHKDTSILMMAAHVKTAGRYASRKKYLPFQDWASVKIPVKQRNRDESFTPEEAIYLIKSERQAGEEINYRMMFCLYWCNMRCGEGHHFRRDWLVPEKHGIIIKRDGDWSPKADKDGRLRLILLSEQVWNELMSWKVSGDYMVSTEEGWRRANETCWAKKFMDLSKKYTKLLKREIHIFAHKFRHSIITGLSDNGATEKAVQLASRHKKPETTNGYIHPSMEQAQKAFQSFADRYWPLTQGTTGGTAPNEK